MTVCSRRFFLAVAAGGLMLGAGAGCGELGSLAYFLMPEQRIDPKMKHLPSEDKEKDSKVVILTWGGLETRSEFIHADRQLSELLARHLRRLAEDGKERLTIVQPRKVEEFKNSHPNWRSLELAEIGRRFEADHVIYLEVNSLTLYEPGMGNMLLRGRINVNVTLADVHQPDDTPPQETFTCTYPGDAPGPVTADNEATKVQFRQAFLDHVARKLSYYFSRYPRRERYRMD